MEYEKSKIMRLNYEVTHRRLLSAVEKMLSEDTEISIKKASQLAGVSAATAYKHGCPQMIRKALSDREETHKN